jgi:hypothetical protein
VTNSIILLYANNRLAINNYAYADNNDTVVFVVVSVVATEMGLSVDKLRYKCQIRNKCQKRNFKFRTKYNITNNYFIPYQMHCHTQKQF